MAAIELHQASELRAVNANNETILEIDLIQGMWTQAQYLKLTNYSRRLIEFTDGTIEVLPMPTYKHQAISRFLLFALFNFVQPRGGTVIYAPLRLEIRPDKFREPDLLLMRDANDPRCQNAYWLGADLVVEIVSPDNPERDTVVKRVDYAEAAIPEYWIVNPEDETVTVLRLEDDHYVEHGLFRRGDTTSSALLTDFVVDVDALLDAR
jgi:Uma2 family endonuclease